MEIQKVIHSSNDEPLYLDFWESVSKIWKLKFGIEPILLYFGDKKISEQYGTVIKIEDLPSVPTYISCLFSRYWYPTTEKNTTFMISDIDMFPISKWYFIDQLKNISDDKYVHLNYSFESPNYLATCYHVAKGSTFESVLELQNSWQDFMNTNIWNKSSHTSYHLKEIDQIFELWGADESWASQKIMNYSNQDIIVKLSRGDNLSSYRLDRSKWSWNENLINKFYDCHCIRPYLQNKNEIDYLVNQIIKNY